MPVSPEDERRRALLVPLLAEGSMLRDAGCRKRPSSDEEPESMPGIVPLPLALRSVP